MTDNLWTIEVNGPHGKKVVCLSNEQVEWFNKNQHEETPHTAALWLAYCDLWTQHEESADV